MRINQAVGAAQWVALMYLATSFLTACTFAEPTTPIPTRQPTGPTIAPSPTLFIPTPSNEEDIIGGVGQNDLTAASLPSRSGLPPMAVGTPTNADLQGVQITAEDGTALIGDLYQDSLRVARVPGVLLLSVERSVWGDFPVRLREAGFTVLSMNLRSGAAINQSDFNTMLHSLSEVGTVDPGRIAVIGESIGADAAMIGCAVDALCDTVVLLSPTNSALLITAMTMYNPRPLMLTASQDDAVSFEVVTALDSSATGEHLLQPFESAGHGAAILQNRPDLSDLIVAWLSRHLIG